MEPVSITAIVVSIITAIGVLLSRLRMKHCLCGCIESDCINTPPQSPTASVDVNITPQPSPYVTRKELNTSSV